MKLSKILIKFGENSKKIEIFSKVGQKKKEEKKKNFLSSNLLFFGDSLSLPYCFDKFKQKTFGKQKHWGPARAFLSFSVTVR